MCCWYIVSCEFEDTFWSVERRYSQFRSLDDHLRNILTHSVKALLSPMPKKLFFARSSASEHQIRRKGLEQYLRTLASLSWNSLETDVSPENEDHHRSLICIFRSLLRFVDFVHKGRVKGAEGVQVARRQPLASKDLLCAPFTHSPFVLPSPAPPPTHFAPSLPPPPLR
jgi:hypothetical protein